ncbi:MAG: glycoside hydrolase family 130 protein [Bacteroidota bacterium]|nr:glycoside hydrolase family 130 protein [Bacteroidota bacterium]
MTDIAKRFTENPLLRPADLQSRHLGLTIDCLLNPGVFRFQQKVWLVVRVAERPAQQEGVVSFPVLDQAGQIKIIEIEKANPNLILSDSRLLRFENADYLTTLSHFRLLCSDDGVHFYETEGYPPIEGSGAYETYGIEDCRVTQIGKEYYLTYTAVSQNGVGVGLMMTEDWIHFDRKHLIFPPHNKDCALFNEKIGPKYYALHRPGSPVIGGNYIWVAESPDLIHWGNHQCIAMTRHGKWDSVRIGAGGAPIRTKQGWLEIYHGADEQDRYCLGALLLDLENPGIVLGRTDDPIMEPVMQYEQQGFFGNVVFTNGHIVDGDQVTIYYGASDEFVCAARFSIDEILKRLI